MDLFGSDVIENILPFDGIVTYYGQLFNAIEAQRYLVTLLKTVEWQNDEVVIFGKHIITKRQVAWFDDKGQSYTYSNTTKRAHKWTPELLDLKTRVEEVTGNSFNSCLLNLYHDGTEGMSWHSDDEKSLAKDGAIASLSFGAERKFSLKHKRTGDTVSIMLANGSLLVMKGTTQANWLHSIPKSTKITKPRINLTFRYMVG